MAKKKAGRPKANIDWEFVDRALEAHCSGAEVAGRLGLHKTTLYNAVEREKGITFSQYAERKKDSGKSLLKMAIFKNAMDGNTSAQVWTSKNLLGWTDKAHQSIETTHAAVGFTYVVPRGAEAPDDDTGNVQHVTEEEYDQLAGPDPERTYKPGDNE